MASGSIRLGFEKRRKDEMLRDFEEHPGTVRKILEVSVRLL
jgi:hypothetical protein